MADKDATVGPVEVKGDLKKVEEEIVKIEKCFVTFITNCYDGKKEFKIGDKVKVNKETADELISAKVAEKK